MSCLVYNFSTFRRVYVMDDKNMNMVSVYNEMQFWQNIFYGSVQNRVFLFVY